MLFLFTSYDMLRVCVVFIHMYEIGVNVILWLSSSRQCCIMCTMCGMDIVILK